MLRLNDLEDSVHGLLRHAVDLLQQMQTLLTVGSGPDKMPASFIPCHMTDALEIYRIGSNMVADGMCQGYPCVYRFISELSFLCHSMKQVLNNEHITAQMNILKSAWIVDPDDIVEELPGIADYELIDIPGI